jgi:hypothetical protein
MAGISSIDQVDYERCRMILVANLRYAKLLSIRAIATELGLNKETVCNLLNSQECKTFVAELLHSSELKTRFAALSDLAFDAVVEALSDPKDKNRSSLAFMILRQILAAGESATPAGSTEFKPDWVQSDETKAE